MNRDLLKILDGISKDDDTRVPEKVDPILKKYDRILIIDGLNLFLRNFAVMNVVNEQGVHIGGLGGTLRSLGYLINTIKPTSAYIVFDGMGSSTNRKNLLPEYKSNRNTGKIMNWEAFDDIDDEDDAKVNQISRLIHYLKCLPVKTISMDKVEADDIIAHLSDQLSTKQNSKVYIVSSDKDFLQKVNHNITVFRPIEKEFLTPEKVKAKFEIPPENFILYKTLLGDSSDKIPGIKGLGPGKLFKLFPELKTRILTLDDIFDICEEKHKEHIIYSRILFETESVLTNYKLMDLSKPMIDDKEKQLIEDLITASTSKLQVDAFMRLYNEDGLKHLIKDTLFWLRDTFKVLNSFNK
jgi:5'-3' exonuclease